MQNKLEQVQEVTSKPKVDSEYVFISIPERDIYDAQHPGVRLNKVKFEAGKTYKVPAEIGAEVQDRLNRFERETIRLMRPKADMKALNDVNRGGMWSTRGGSDSFSLEGGLRSVGGANETVITIDNLL